MIRYTLKCARGHDFDSWFNSAASYDKLKAQGLISCTVCGEAQVEKAVMAPQVRPGRNRPDAPAPAPAPAPAAAASAAAGGSAAPVRPDPAAQMRAALGRLRAEIEARCENVGRDFAREARAIHAGEAPDRPIIGEARPTEARSLIEDGIPVAPLPWPARKPN